MLGRVHPEGKDNFGTVIFAAYIGIVIIIIIIIIIINFIIVLKVEIGHWKSTMSIYTNQLDQRY